MISAQYSSNNGKNLVTKKPSQHDNILNKKEDPIKIYGLKLTP